MLLCEAFLPFSLPPPPALSFFIPFSPWGRPDTQVIQHKTTDVVLRHPNQKGHKLTDIELILLELVNSKRESIRKARESFYIDKVKTKQPRGMKREDDY